MSKRNHIGEVALGVNLDSSPLETQARALERTMKGIGAKLGAALGLGMSLKALVDFSKKCIDLGSDLAEVQNVVDVTFKSMRGEINEFAQNAAKQFGLSETMAKRYAGTFGAMSKAFGFAEKDAAEMSMALTGLAGDVASFYNIDQDAAYTKLKSVFTGETESLKDLGIVMTQTALDQFAIEQGLGRSTAAMSEQQKVALRYQFILSKLSDVSGDFSRTSDSWANQVRILKLQFESLCATIGEGLIAALTPAIKALNAFMGGLIKAANTFKSFVYSLFGKESQDMTTGSGAAAAALSTISEGAEDASSSLGDVGDSATGAGNNVAAAANQIRRSLTSFDKITKLASQSTSGSSGSSGSSSGSGGTGSNNTAVGGLGDTSSALTNTAYEVADDNGPLSKVLQRLGDIKNLITSGFWDGLADADVFRRIGENIDGIGNSLRDIFTDSIVIDAANNFLDTLAYNIGREAGALISVGATIAEKLTGGIKKYLEQGSERLKEYLVRVFDIGSEIANLCGNWAESFADIFSVFGGEDAQQITADIINIFSLAFENITTLALKLGRDIIDLITSPIVANKDAIKTALENTLAPVRTVLDTLSSFWETVWEKVQEIYDGHIKPVFESIRDTITNVIEILVDGYNTHVAPVLEKLSKKFKEVFEDHVKPMVDSLGEVIGAIFDVLKDIWNNLLSPFFTWIAEKIMPVLGAILDIVGTALLDAIGFLADAVKAIFDFLSQKNGVIDAISDGIGGLAGILGAAAEAAGNVVAWLLKLPSGVTTTVKLAKDAAFDSIRSVWDGLVNSNVVKTLKAVKDAAFDTVKSAWEAIKDGVASKAVQLAKDGWSTVTSWISDARNLGSGAVDKAISLAKSGWDTVTNWVKNSLGTTSLNKGIGLARDGWESVTKWIKAKHLGGVLQKGIRLAKEGWTSISSFVGTAGSALEQKVKLVRDGWTTVAKWIGNSKFGAAYKVGISLIRYGWTTLATWIKQAIGKGLGYAYGGLTGVISVGVQLVKRGWSSFKSWFGIKSGGYYTGHGFSLFAEGGKITGSGKASWWDSVPKYAGGTSQAHGTMFMAGEAGPEVVGHVNGSTEVLNKSQLAAALSAGVGMAIVKASSFNQDRYLPKLLQAGVRTERSADELLTLAKEASVLSGAGSMTEMLAVLRQILAYLQTLDFDVKIDGRSVKDRIVQLINQQTMATGVCELVL